MVIALPFREAKVALIARIALELFLGYIDHFLFDEHLRPVALIEAALLLLRPLAELLEVRKIVDYVLAGAYFALHNIILVEEDNQAGGGEETILPNGAKQIKCLLQAILIGILPQILIEFAARYEKQHGLNALKHLYPLVALIPLTAHIVHAKLLLTAAQALGYGHTECDFRDARGYLSAVQYILSAGYIVAPTNSRKVIKKTKAKENWKCYC